MPVLNEEKLLERTLRCFPPHVRAAYNAELIVSDGGSTDATLDIASRWADRVVTHSGSERQTIAGGRDKGALASHGSVLVFLNGDTFPADVERFLQVITDFANRRGAYGRATALACPVHIDPAESIPFDRVFHSLYNSWVCLLNTARIGAGRGECQVVRRDAFFRVDGYRTQLAAGEDFDLLARIGLQARVMFARELLVYESPRRFRRFGYLRILWWWTLNAVCVLFTGRSSSDDWEQVR